MSGMRPGFGRHDSPAPFEYLILDEDQLKELEMLCFYQYGPLELAKHFNISRQTIIHMRERSPEIVKTMQRGYCRGRIALRARQFQLGLQGNVSMLIFLGATILNQLQQPDKRTLNFSWNTYGRLNGNGNGHAIDGIDPETAQLSGMAKEHLSELAVAIAKVAAEANATTPKANSDLGIAFDPESINRS
jgi:hypothetical protein